MANLSGPIGRSILNTIKNTPRPDRTKLREEADACLAAILKEECYTVNFNWDDEAKVWYTTSEDIPGLLLEADTVDKLMARIKVAAPEMMEANGIKPVGKINCVCNRILQLEEE